MNSFHKRLPDGAAVFHRHLSVDSGLLVEIGFVVDKLKRHIRFGRCDLASIVFLESLSQIRRGSLVKPFLVLLALKDIEVVHGVCDVVMTCVVS